MRAPPWLALLFFASSPNSAVSQFNYGGMRDPFCDNQCPDLKDYFQVLGVDEQNATRSSLKRACRSLLAAHHPDKQRTAAKKEENLATYHGVQEACEQLGVHKTGEDDPAGGSAAEKFSDYVNKLKLCRECDRAEQSGAYGGGGGRGTGLGGMGQAAWEMAFGPGAVGREESFERGTRKFRREVVCKSNARETVCQDLEYELVGGSEWLEDPQGWSDPYVPEEGSEDDLNGAAARAEAAGRLYDPYVPAGEYLMAGAFVTSRDGSHFAMTTSDGNFAVFEGSGPYGSTPVPPELAGSGRGDGGRTMANLRPIWETKTYSAFGAFAVLQTDGNLVVREGNAPGVGETGNILWSSNKRVTERAAALYNHHRRGGGGGVGMEGRSVYAVLEDDGNLAVMAAEELAGEEECLWASVRCAGDANLVSGVRAVRNAMRLSVRRVGEGLATVLPKPRRDRRDGRVRFGPRKWLWNIKKWLRQRSDDDEDEE